MGKTRRMRGGLAQRLLRIPASEGSLSPSEHRVLLAQRRGRLGCGCGCCPGRNRRPRRSALAPTACLDRHNGSCRGSRIRHRHDRTRLHAVVHGCRRPIVGDRNPRCSPRRFGRGLRPWHQHKRGTANPNREHRGNPASAQPGCQHRPRLQRREQGRPSPRRRSGLIMTGLLRDSFFPQRPAQLPNAGVDRVDVEAPRGCDLGPRHALDLGEYEQLAVFGAQPVEIAIQRDDGLRYRPARVGLDLRQGVGPGIASPRRPTVVARNPAGNGVQPRLRGACKPLSPPVCDDEHILKRVFERGAGETKSVQGVPDEPVVSLIDLPELTGV